MNIFTSFLDYMGFYGEEPDTAVYEEPVAEAPVAVPEPKPETRSADETSEHTPIVLATDAPDWWNMGETSADAAMKVATVFRCVDIKASTVASLGLRLLRRRKEVVGGVSKFFFEEDESDLLNQLLSLQPNSHMTSYDLIYNAVTQIELRGNAYIVPLYSAGEVTSLCLLSPDAAVNYDKIAGIYDVADQYNHVFGQFHTDEIIHLKNMSMDGGFTGVSTLTYAGSVLGIALNTDSLQKDQFKKGTMLRGFVSGDSSTTQGFGQQQDKQLKAVSERIEAQANSGRRINFLPGNMAFHPTGITPSELQLLDSKKFNVLEVCRFFGVHPDKVFESTSTNYKASENSQTVFMTDTLHPLIKKIENEFNVKLIAMKNRSKLRIRFNLDNYYEADMATKADYYTKRLQIGTLTPNEVRLREGMTPVEGGDTVFISCNVAPIDSEKIRGGAVPENGNEGAQTPPANVNRKSKSK